VTARTEGERETKKEKQTRIICELPRKDSIHTYLRLPEKNRRKTINKGKEKVTNGTYP
jgi:hypothetical protein